MGKRKKIPADGSESAFSGFAPVSWYATDEEGGSVLKRKTASIGEKDQKPEKVGLIKVMNQLCGTNLTSGVGQEPISKVRGVDLPEHQVSHRSRNQRGAVSLRLNPPENGTIALKIITLPEKRFSLDLEPMTDQ